MFVGFHDFRQSLEGALREGRQQDERRTPLVSTDAVHGSYSLHDVFDSNVISLTFRFKCDHLRCCTNALRTTCQ